MANKKLCRFCSRGYVPQRDELICPVCAKEVSRAVSMPVGEPVILDAKGPEMINLDLESVSPEPEVTAEDLEEELSKDEPEPEKEPEPEVLPEPEPEPVVVKASAPEPEPEPEVPKSAEENRYQKDVVNPTE